MTTVNMVFERKESVQCLPRRCLALGAWQLPVPRSTTLPPRLASALLARSAVNRSKPRSAKEIRGYQHAVGARRCGRLGADRFPRLDAQEQHDGRKASEIVRAS